VQADLPRFAGSEEHALDGKGRLIVPARFRERLGSPLILTIAQPEQCLALYPNATWAQICSAIEAAPNKDARYRSIVRHLFAHTEEGACDNQGRLLIPGRLRDYAGIDRQVLSVGVLARVEIWAAERYAVQTPAQNDVSQFVSDLGLY
jgi:MraZ protein